MCNWCKACERGSLLSGDPAKLRHFNDQHCAGNRAYPGNGTQDTRKCQVAITGRGVAAVIPPARRPNPGSRLTVGAIARNVALHATKHLDEVLWRKWDGYNRRSRVETKLHCMKLPGQRLSIRDPGRQVAEFQSRVAVMNGFTALAIPITEALGQVCPGRGEAWRSVD